MRPSVLECGHSDSGRALVLRGAHLAASECPFCVRIHTETTRMESAGAIDRKRRYGGTPLFGPTRKNL